LTTGHRRRHAVNLRPHWPVPIRYVQGADDCRYGDFCAGPRKGTDAHEPFLSLLSLILGIRDQANADLDVSVIVHVKPNKPLPVVLRKLAAPICLENALRNLDAARL